MINLKTQKPENARFKVVETTSDKTVYQRVIKAKGKSAKEIAEIVSELPTATFHTYTLEEFERLKGIEDSLYKNLEIKFGKKSLKDIIFSFLEI